MDLRCHGFALALCSCVGCGAPPEPAAARAVARAPRAPEEPACAGSLEATRSLWLQGLAARKRGNEAEAQELFECARGALEHVAGSPAQLEVFQSPAPMAWREGFGYWLATSAATEERYVVQTLADRSVLTLTPLSAIRVSGGEAVLSPGGRRLLVFGTDQLEVVDVPTLRSSPIQSSAEIVPQGEFADDGRTFVSFTGGTACGGDAGLAVIDLEGGEVKLQASGEVSDLSPSKHHAALVTREVVGGKAHHILRIWDLRDLARDPIQTDLGSFTGGLPAVQFDAEEQSVIVSECGMGGAGHFEGFKTRAAVDLRDGKLRAPPKVGIPPRDAAERWPRLAVAFAVLARPLELVATDRGPGGFLSFAETADGNRVALLTGEVDSLEIQSVSQPALLLADAPSAQLQHLKLPFPDAATPYTGGRVEFSPTGTHVLVCLEGERTESAVVDVASSSASILATPTDGCEWSFSADGAALLTAGAAWDVMDGLAYQLPFARDEAWRVCRAGAVLAPSEICSEGRDTGS